MRICLMVEGQEGVTWDDWVALGQACEDAGLEGLFRSDHYLSVMGRSERGSLDAWTTLAGLAATTSRIRLGTLVSPVTFRHPAVLAKSAVTVDHISGGRLEVGMGAGWFEGEHDAYGFPFPNDADRIAELSRQLEIVHGHWTDGEHLPLPIQSPHPNLIVGGSAGPHSARLAARWADEYNTLLASTEECARRRARLERAWQEAGRDQGTLTLSLMTTCIVGTDEREVAERARRVMEVVGASGSVEDWMEARRDRSIIGTQERVAERLRELAGAGVDRVMLQHLAHEDLEMVALLGSL